MMKGWKKLNDQRGESLTEVLVALLVGALAITMLAGAIVSSQQMVRHSGEVMDEYYAANCYLDSHPVRTTPNTLPIEFADMNLEMKDSAGNKVGKSETVTGYVHKQGNDDIVAYAAG